MIYCTPSEGVGEDRARERAERRRDNEAAYIQVEQRMAAFLHRHILSSMPVVRLPFREIS